MWKNRGATKIRLDPANKSGFVHIHNLKIFDISVDSGPSPLLELNSSAEIIAAAEMEDLHHCRNGLGEVFMATSEDPFMVFQLPDPVQNALEQGSVIVEITMELRISLEASNTT